MTLRESILAQAYSRMTDDEKRMYAILKKQDETQSAVAHQSEALNRIERNTGWWPEYANNVLSNITTDAIGWLFLKLFKRL